ncbi:hypothetical protein BJ508DRAFT_308983 [Ascobolus immersus RN42]|uniref:Uncharacterized protein n=1 Tax=Ascobolus immersus RN42 TaxID=1160509 RepID=A0A3N4I2B5_ASCIM|nr:hypothetical protein BJ508DRAFT_308983 [Ascobolus immersus RN42]
MFPSEYSIFNDVVWFQLIRGSSSSSHPGTASLMVRRMSTISDEREGEDVSVQSQPTAIQASPAPDSDSSAISQAEEETVSEPESYPDYNRWGGIRVFRLTADEVDKFRWLEVKHRDIVDELMEGAKVVSKLITIFPTLERNDLLQHLSPDSAQRRKIKEETLATSDSDGSDAFVPQPTPDFENNQRGLEFMLINRKAITTHSFPLEKGKGSVEKQIPSSGRCNQFTFRSFLQPSRSWRESKNSKNWRHYGIWTEYGNKINFCKELLDDGEEGWKWIRRTKPATQFVNQVLRFEFPEQFAKGRNRDMVREVKKAVPAYNSPYQLFDAFHGVAINRGISGEDSKKHRDYHYDDNQRNIVIPFANWNLKEDENEREKEEFSGAYLIFWELKIVMELPIGFGTAFLGGRITHNLTPVHGVRCSANDFIHKALYDWADRVMEKDNHRGKDPRFAESFGTKKTGRTGKIMAAKKRKKEKLPGKFTKQKQGQVTKGLKKRIPAVVPDLEQPLAIDPKTFLHQFSSHRQAFKPPPRFGFPMTIIPPIMPPTISIIHPVTSLMELPASFQEQLLALSTNPNATVTSTNTSTNLDLWARDALKPDVLGVLLLDHLGDLSQNYITYNSMPIFCDYDTFALKINGKMKSVSAADKLLAKSEDINCAKWKSLLQSCFGVDAAEAETKLATTVFNLKKIDAGQSML